MIFIATTNISNENYDTQEQIDQVASFSARYKHEMEELQNQDEVNEIINLAPESMQLINAFQKLAQSHKLPVINDNFNLKSYIGQLMAVLNEPIQWHIIKPVAQDLQRVYAQEPSLLGRFHFVIATTDDPNLDLNDLQDVCDDLNKGASKYIAEPFIDLFTSMYQSIDWYEFKQLYPTAIYDGRLRFDSTIQAQINDDYDDVEALKIFHQNSDNIKSEIKSHPKDYDLQSVMEFVQQGVESLIHLTDAPYQKQYIHIDDIDKWHDKYVAPMMDDIIVWANNPEAYRDPDLEPNLSDEQRQAKLDTYNAKRDCKVHVKPIINAIDAINKAVNWKKLK